MGEGEGPEGIVDWAGQNWGLIGSYTWWYRLMRERRRRRLGGREGRHVEAWSSASRGRESSCGRRHTERPEAAVYTSNYRLPDRPPPVQTQRKNDWQEEHGDFEPDDSGHGSQTDDGSVQ